MPKRHVETVAGCSVHEAAAGRAAASQAPHAGFAPSQGLRERARVKGWGQTAMERLSSA